MSRCREECRDVEMGELQPQSGPSCDQNRRDAVSTSSIERPLNSAAKSLYLLPASIRNSAIQKNVAKRELDEPSRNQRMSKSVLKKVECSMCKITRTERCQRRKEKEEKERGRSMEGARPAGGMEEKKMVANAGRE